MHPTSAAEGPAPVVELAGALTPREGWSAEGCMVAATLEVVGTRSAFVLMREAFYGCTRFDDFTRHTGLSEPVAAARLRELVDHGLLEREPYREPGQRTRQAYRLTPKGADLFPAMVALMQWGNRWLADDGGNVQLRHRECGATVGAALRCAADHPVGMADLELVAGTDLA